MSIVQLSDATTRAITSSLVLNDAVSIIKELLDNALDSRANHITIEISPNTLDVIQVKDDGIGIGVEDRQCLCKRGYTSKIRTVDDLANLGGTSLGFRGEALASIAELSESVTVTTRVDGETVATLLKHDKTGKLTHCASASHGTGTTIRVENALKSIPVRKQTALKQTARTLALTKKLLFEYAFARPSVRFLFKVIKAKSEKANWSYIPCKDSSNLVEAASKIVGKDVVSMCQQVTSQVEADGYKLHALLLSPGLSDYSRTQSAGQYCSIDGRPLNTERGVIKDIVKIYRTFQEHRAKDGIRIPQKPFIVLHLTCPRGSYDVNIEPSKNEVLFEDNKVILRLAKDVFEQVYGETDKQSQPSRQEHELAEATQNDEPAFDMLLARKNLKPTDKGLHPSTDEVLSLLFAESQDFTNSSSARSQSFEIQVRNENRRMSAGVPEMGSSRSMYNLNDEDEGQFDVSPSALGERNSYDAEDQPESVMHPRITNPFTLAKLNVRVPARILSSESSPQGSEPSPQQSSNSHIFNRKPTDFPNRQGTLEHQGSSEPLDSLQPYQNPGPPNRPWRRRADVNDNEDDDASDTPEILNLGTLPAPPPSLLDSWVKSVNAPNGQEADRVSGFLQSESTSLSQHRKIAHPRRASAADNGLFASAEDQTRHSQKPFHQPLRNTNLHERSPNKPQYRERLQGPEMSPISPGGVAATYLARDSQQERSSSNWQNVTPPSNNSDLDDIMDFEHRKRYAILQHRKNSQKQSLIDADFISPIRTLSSSARGSTPDPSDTSTNHFVVPARPQDEGLSETRKTIKRRHETGAEKSKTNLDRIQNLDNEDIPPQTASASYTQNPHWNRFQAAVRHLKSPVHSKQSLTNEKEDPNTRTDGQYRKTDRVVFENERLSPIGIPPIADSDPRGVLIKHYRTSRSRAERTDRDHAFESASVPNNGSKRPKLYRLPFETLFPQFSTYRLVAELEAVTNDVRSVAGKIESTPDHEAKDHSLRLPLLPDIQMLARCLGSTDTYIPEPSGQITITDWRIYSKAEANSFREAGSEPAVHLRDLANWESKLKALINAQYTHEPQKAREVPEGASSGRIESDRHVSPICNAAAPGDSISLLEAVRVHVEHFT